MGNTFSMQASHKVGFLHHIRLVPLFSSILGGILLLFALSAGLAGYFLLQADRDQRDVTDEIQVRMGLSNSANHLRTARINMIHAGAASRIAEMDEMKANIAAAETRIKQSQDGFNAYMSRAVKTPADDALDNKLNARYTAYINGLQPMLKFAKNGMFEAIINHENEQAKQLDAAYNHVLLKAIELRTERARLLSEQAYQRTRLGMMFMIGAFTLALVLTLMTFMVLRRTVIQPLQQSASRIERIAAGDLTMADEPTGRSEIGRLSHHLQQMQHALQQTVGAVRQGAAEILSQRDIFTSRCRQLLDEYDEQGGFSAAQAEEFVRETLETFRWHRQATVDEETYLSLHREHRLIADVVCFPGCHINHLTPRTLDIDRVQAMMPECGITPKTLIEGPPRREVPILLRQTSFKALEEQVLFVDEKQGTHTARFGEIEQRGVALTPKGRRLYDELLHKAGTGKDNFTHQLHLREVFNAFPDSEFLLRQQGLAWFRYRLTPSGEAHRQAIHPGDDPQPLIERGWVIAQPITYEDFLPVSAAGIFQSNLGNETLARSHGNASRDAFEQALGCAVRDEFSLYQEAEERSKRRCGLL